MALICAAKWWFFFERCGQYGHGSCGSFPHSTFKCADILRLYLQTTEYHTDIHTYIYTSLLRGKIKASQHNFAEKL